MIAWHPSIRWSTMRYRAGRTFQQKMQRSIDNVIDVTEGVYNCTKAVVDHQLRRIRLHLNASSIVGCTATSAKDQLCGDHRRRHRTMVRVGSRELAAKAFAPNASVRALSRRRISIRFRKVLKTTRKKSVANGPRTRAPRRNRQHVRGGSVDEAKLIKWRHVIEGVSGGRPL